MSELNIHQRMHAVMKSVGYVQKEDKKVNNQYTFVSHDAVTAKIRPALIENGIWTGVRVVKHTQDGNRTEVDIEVDFVNIDRPDDRVTIPTFGYGIDPQDKGPGKAISYAVKYAYLKAFALETGDDPEKDLIEHKPKKFPSPVVSALEGVSVDKDKVGKVAATLIDLHAAAESGEDTGYAAFETVETLESEEKLAVWAELAPHSKVRSWLKKVSAEHRTANAH